jgi:hypothetical protein
MDIFFEKNKEEIWKQTNAIIKYISNALSYEITNDIKKSIYKNVMQKIDENSISAIPVMRVPISNTNMIIIK